MNVSSNFFSFENALACSRARVDPLIIIEIFGTYMLSLSACRLKKNFKNFYHTLLTSIRSYVI
jgi:hypothetical protein